MAGLILLLPFRRKQFRLNLFRTRNCPLLPKKEKLMFKTVIGELALYKLERLPYRRLMSDIQIEKGGQYASTIEYIGNEDGMFRELDKVNTDISGSWLKGALLVSYTSIAITLTLGIAYFVLSTIDGSPAAFGFAFAAILDACSSAVVVWRFSGLAGQKYSFERERKACIIIGGCFVLSGTAIMSKAVYMLVIDHEPKRSTALLITTFATFALMVLLAWFKYLIAYKVDSRALRTDAFNSTAEAVMAFVMAMSDLIYDQNTHIWFLDASAAMFIAFILFVYGVRTIVELLLTKGMAPIPSE